MQERGFEPPNPLREQLLRLSRLTTSLLLLKNNRNPLYKKLYKLTTTSYFEDGLSNRVIPDLIPNSEVKAITLFVLVADKL